MDPFFVSIIIPVYNAANYVAQAVESALAQPETAEVILIEDGSSDDSLQVCQKLAEKYKKVSLLQHLGGVNKGAGASRNLGMQNAKYDYIAFLDSDDFYLPGRFAVAKEILNKTPNCDGVYEALGIYFENEEARSKWLESDMKHVEITTMTKMVKPEELFENLIKGGAGYFSLDALVFKRSLIIETGCLNENLLLHQDTEFSLRLAAVATLLPGRLDEPVAVRRVHDQNRITAPRSDSKKYRYRMMMFKSLYSWFKRNSTQENASRILFALVAYSMNHKHFNGSRSRFTQSEINRRLRLIFLGFEFPEVIFHKLYWRKFLPQKLRYKYESKYK